MHKRIAMSQIDYMIVINSYYDAADVDQQLLERVDLFLSSFFTYIFLPGMRACQGSAGRMFSDRFSTMFYPLHGYFYRSLGAGLHQADLRLPFEQHHLHHGTTF